MLIINKRDLINAINNNKRINKELIKNTNDLINNNKNGDINE